MRIVHVVGARPNLMKLAPVYRAIAKFPAIEQLVVHTGQHYDFNMSDVFFQQLCTGAPDINLQVGSASHAKQTAEVMVRFESVVLERRPDLVLVYGDVNSTVLLRWFAQSWRFGSDMWRPGCARSIVSCRRRLTAWSRISWQTYYSRRQKTEIGILTAKEFPGKRFTWSAT